MNKFMKILLSGVETKNKGAELMLYAILQEIERKYPKAIVYIPGDRLFQGICSISTNLDFRIVPCRDFEKFMHLDSLFIALHIPYRFLPHILSLGRVDYYLDGSGFKFSDQFSVSKNYVKLLRMKLTAFKQKGTKLIFLPQAFGPFEKSNSKEIVSILNDTSSLIMAREVVSYNFLKKTGRMDLDKVKIFTDFTSLVEGIFPLKFNHLRDGVCIIPNMRMIDKGTISYKEYNKLLHAIIEESAKSGKPVYLLNHEGEKDERLCYQCQKEMGDNVEVVSGLNALEVKGLIASAYLVVTSRFHGLASSLNSCVPALSTSWSHKYEELYKDYSLEGYVLPLDHQEKAMSMIKQLLDPIKNIQIREHLRRQLPKIKEQTIEMWNVIWSL